MLQREQLPVSPLTQVRGDAREKDVDLATVALMRPSQRQYWRA